MGWGNEDKGAAVIAGVFKVDTLILYFNVRLSILLSIAFCRIKDGGENTTLSPSM